MTSALLIPVDKEEPIRRVDVNGLSDLQAAVGGGYVEAISYWDGEDVTAYIREEGKYDGSESNPRATRLFGPGLFAGDDIRGPMLVCGFDARTGEHTDLRQGFEEKLTEGRMLPQPDVKDIKKGRAEFKWKLRSEPGEENERIHYAVLSCYHSTGPSRYWAVLTNRSEEETRWAHSMGFMPGVGNRLAERQIKRYTQKSFDEFVRDVLTTLFTLYADSDPRITRHFAVESGGALTKELA